MTQETKANDMEISVNAFYVLLMYEYIHYKLGENKDYSV